MASLRLQSWGSAQRCRVHRWAISRPDGYVCTCGLIIRGDPLADQERRRIFGWLGQLDTETDSATALSVVADGPYDHDLL